MLPPFVDSTHCLSYNLTRKGRNVADRVMSVLGYACPDITYSPSLYPLTALFLHFVPGKLYIILLHTRARTHTHIHTSKKIIHKKLYLYNKFI